MPLNPNGKIDKPALPFPDTVQAATIAPTNAQKGNSTEDIMRGIWSSILPNPPQNIPLDESFFDLGGHSILATRLIFEIRKVFVVNAPLGLVFDQPTIRGLVAAVDSIRNADLNLEYNASRPAPILSPGAPAAKTAAQVEYSQDYENLVPQLRESYPSANLADFAKRDLTIFLTGATGFLGAFILRDLLSRPGVAKVICLVRASSVEKAVVRLREGSSDRGVWDDEWVTSRRLEVVTGDLSLEKFGLVGGTWDRIAAEADVILHNGALVSAYISFELKRRPKHLDRSTGCTLMRSSVLPMFCLHWQQLSSPQPTSPRTSSSSLRPPPSIHCTMCNCQIRSSRVNPSTKAFQRATTLKDRGAILRLGTVNPSGCPRSFSLRPDAAV